jgi:phosphatidylserine decarboxylase
MITKDGYKIIASFALGFAVLLTAAVITQMLVFQIAAVLILSLFIFSLFFFRNPERNVVLNENQIISPADGTVIKIELVDEAEFFKGKARLVSVFMSVFNVHVNRIPISGKVTYLKYKKGKYLAAFADEASDLNEQSIIGIEGDGKKVLFKQIAGLIARRVIYRLKEGQEVEQGSLFGMIKFGSRLDIFMPESAKVKVKLKDKVKGGISIIGEFK